MNGRKSWGFTIPELLAVIVIIGILAVMATGSYITISNQVKAKTLKTKLDYINEKAINYANDYSIEDTTMTVAKLISEGYLDMENVTDDNTKINNPEGGYLDCYKIKITRESDNYNSEITPSDDCSLANSDVLASNLDVGVYAINKLGTNLVSNNKTNWTNSDVVLYVNPNYLRNNGLLDKVVSITW
ncbi:MAG: type II secretion system protein, partial [bacterium]|nr:type II secretion system protein [bacterium]